MTDELLAARSGTTYMIHATTEGAEKVACGRSMRHLSTGGVLWNESAMRKCPKCVEALSAIPRSTVVADVVHYEGFATCAARGRDLRRAGRSDVTCAECLAVLA